MAAVAELKGRGYDVRPLEKLVYTDGVTYDFPQGMYFTCHAETDTESTIFNSDLKKLGYENNDRVILRIKNTTSRDPNEWNARRKKSKRTNVYHFFNTIKMRAALIASDAGVSITEFCGIVPVFKNTPPCSYVSHYEIETKKMRDRLTESNKIEIVNPPDPWLPIDHTDGNEKWTAAQHELVDRYEMHKTDGAIRHRETKNVLGPNTSTLGGMVGDAMITVHVERYRVYMWTFMKHKKREHQNIVDHIDGDRANNAPWNLRWMSDTENCLAKHSAMTKRVVPDMVALHETHGAPSDPKMWHGWTFHSNMWITRPDKTEFVAYSTEGTYPKIGANLKNASGKIHNIKCHLIVAHLHRIPTSDRASDRLESLGKSRNHFLTFKGSYFEYARELKSCGLVIMHDDDDKANYTLKNLKIGTRSENGEARHANPETTGCKRVDLVDTTTHERQTFDSQIEAAESLGRPKSTISSAVRINRTLEIGSYRVTTHKSTGATYYVVDAV